MQIVFTDAAKEQLETKAAGSGRLKLVYDTEGCGCAVNGVPDLWIEPAQPEHSGELAVESNYVPVACDRKSEVFFEDRMTVDYNPERKSFVLKSTGQIYNASLSLKDKR